MLNDRDEKFDDQEESEYHFSDDEANYEVEADAPKPVVAAAQKEPLLNRLTRSKRMLISLGVFLVLIFVVYKMVAPGDAVTPPPADITPAAPVAQAQSAVQTPLTAAQQPPVIPVAPVASPPTVAAPMVSTPTPPPSAPAMSSPVQQPTPVMTPPVPPVATAMPGSPVGAAPGMEASSVMQPAQAVPSAQPVGTQAVIPVQTTPPVTVTPVSNSMVPMTVLASESAKLINQLQSDYAQKMADYSNQNKALQDQVQALSARVASMETQMQQLIQVLTRQTTRSSSATTVAPAASSGPEPKVAYNVQAIIPGRAWLRADSGETVTVTEGDVIRDVGRVTKIDPYDGVVEINTGNRVVSLSYGNGG